MTGIDVEFESQSLGPPLVGRPRRKECREGIAGLQRVRVYVGAAGGSRVEPEARIA